MLNHSCKKDDPVATPPKDSLPVKTEQAFSFQLKQLVGESNLVYNQIFTDTTGRTFTLSDCRFYISNIVLIKNDNTEVPLTGKVILADPYQSVYALGNVPVGNYSGFRFLMGLDSATNHADPTQYPSDNPLSLQINPMHWSWNSGYLFMKMEGAVDTSANANQPPAVPMSFHIATDDITRSIQFYNHPFTVSTFAASKIKLVFDAKVMLNNIDLTTEYFTHSTGPGRSLANKIADNWQGSFRIDL